jgi:ubiquinone/menaquinone biosynthesis C-methylase UbiE
METPIERMYRRHAPFYDVTRSWLLPGRPQAVRRLGVQPGDRVLDFACGTGLNMPLLRRAGAGAIVGIDLSEAMLARARRNHPFASYLRADLADVDAGPPAPRVICTFGLSVVADPEGAFRNLHRHVAPGGTLVLLDFGEPPGLPGRLLEAWLARFGVRSPRGAGAWVARLFERATRDVIQGGVAQILGGDCPRPARLA